MLTITVSDTEGWDEENEVFVPFKGTELKLEHSLVALSKWESKYEKPFLTNGPMTPEEFLSYVEFMCVDPNTPPEVFSQVGQIEVDQIVKYMATKQTATWFSDKKHTPPSREIMTAELVYYQMAALSIPFECDTWHLNKLFTLIRISALKQEKPKKRSRAEAAAQQRELNAQRKAQMGSRG